MSNKTKKLLILNLPYFIAGLVCTNLGEAWRIAEGADMSEKLLGFLSALGAAFSNPMPSLHPGIRSVWLPYKAHRSESQTASGVPGTGYASVYLRTTRRSWSAHESRQRSRRA